MMCNGEFLQKDPDEAFEYLDDLAEKSYTWNGPSPMDKPRSTGIYQLREEDNVKSQIESLRQQFEAFKSQEGRGIHMAAKVETRDPCFICGGTEHQPQECPTLGELRGGNEEQCNALGDYKKPYNPFSNTYNPGWRNHPNFSWKDSNQASGSQWRSDQQQLPKAYIAPQNNMQSRNSLEYTLQMLAQTKIASTQELKSCFT